MYGDYTCLVDLPTAQKRTFIPTRILASPLFTARLFRQLRRSATLERRMDIVSFGATNPDGMLESYSSKALPQAFRIVTYRKIAHNLAETSRLASIPQVRAG